jgi:hypothetical protein
VWLVLFNTTKSFVQPLHKTRREKEKNEKFFRFAEMSANDGTERETKPSVQGFNRFLFIPGVVVPPPERERVTRIVFLNATHTNNPAKPKKKTISLCMCTTAPHHNDDGLSVTPLDLFRKNKKYFYVLIRPGSRETNGLRGGFPLGLRNPFHRRSPRISLRLNWTVNRTDFIWLFEKSFTTPCATTPKSGPSIRVAQKFYSLSFSLLLFLSLSLALLSVYKKREEN